MNRRLFAFGLLAAAFVILDLLSPFSRTGSEMLRFWVPSLAMGALAIHASRQRWARVLCAGALGTVWIIQAAAIRTYAAPLDYQIADAARFAWHDIRPVVVRALPAVVGAGALCGTAWYFAARYAAQTLPRPALFAALALALLGLVTPSRGTPEYRALSAVPLLFAKPSQPLSVDAPPLPALPIEKPVRVLFVLGESLRAADYCGDPGTPCEVAPRVHALLPKRVALRSMRSLASYTAVSTAVLLSGRTQLGDRIALAGNPTMLDIGVRLQHRDQPLGAFYYGSQLASVFDRTPKISAFVPFEQVLGRDVREDEEVLDSNADGMMVDRFLRDLTPSWGLSVLHFSGTHAPYYIDPQRAYFTPYSRSVSWSSLDNLHRAYRSAIRIQDEEVARAIEGFTKLGDPWVVLFTSDHGEAFGEHHAVHHGQNLYDEQTHVPGFVAWSEGFLSQEQERTLRERALGPTTHLDVLPTVLDVFGVLDAPQLKGLSLEGESLLRARRKTPRALPMTNCTEYYPCPLSTWGILGETHALIGQPWDRTLRCVRLDGTEESRGAECARLQVESARAFPMLPNGTANR